MADELTEHLQKSAQGGLILIFRQMTSTVIAAIASILVARCARVLLNSWN